VPLSSNQNALTAHPVLHKPHHPFRLIVPKNDWMLASNNGVHLLPVIPARRASSASCVPRAMSAPQETRHCRSHSRSQPFPAGPTCLPVRRSQAGAADRPASECTPAGITMPDTLPQFAILTHASIDSASLEQAAEGLVRWTTWLIFPISASGGAMWCSPAAYDAPYALLDHSPCCFPGCRGYAGGGGSRQRRKILGGNHVV
jgi:hypothetical protein